MVLSGISDDARRLFEAHGVLVPGQAAETHEKEPTPVEDESDAPVTVRIADTMDSALEWCEDDILRREASEHHRRVSLTYPGIEGVERSGELGGKICQLKCCFSWGPWHWRRKV